MKTGALKGVMSKTTPLGSARSLGPIGKKLKLNSARWDFVHFSRLSYAVRTSM